jgi:Protein of unknown function (DUF3500)
MASDAFLAWTNRTVLRPGREEPYLSIPGHRRFRPRSRREARQFDALMALMEEYARNVPDELAEGRMRQINKAGRNIYFAWSGGINHGDPHYYRVQTPYILIELDDTQDNANHIHCVWRDFADDFGEDLLQQHYQASH